MLTKYPKNYSDVVDEWLAWNQSAGPKLPTFASVDQYAKYMDQREQVDTRQAAYNPDFLQKANDFVERTLSVPGTAGMFGPGTGKIKLSDIGAGYGRVVGEAAAETFNMPELAPAIEEAGRFVPRAMLGVGAAAGASALAPAAAPVGIGAMLADAALSAYGPQGDAVAGVVAPLTAAATMGVMPAAGLTAQKLVANRALPTLAELAQMPKTPFGAAAGKVLGQTATPAMENAMSVARIGGEALAGTAVGEAGRIVEQGIKGEDVSLFDPVSLAANLVSTAAFAPLDVKLAQQLPPAKVFKSFAERRVAQAVNERIERHAQAAGQGSRVGELYKIMVDLSDQGQDTTAVTEALRKEYTDAADYEFWKGSSPEAVAGASLKELKKYGPIDVEQIISGLKGKFDELAARDPETREPGTVSGIGWATLVKQGFLPPLSDKLLLDVTQVSKEQALDDPQVAREVMVNKLYYHYLEQIPRAKSDRLKAVETNLEREQAQSKKQQVANETFQLDEQYITQALYPIVAQMRKMNRTVPLQPFMKDLVKPAIDPTTGLPFTEPRVKLEDAFMALNLWLAKRTGNGILDFERTATRQFTEWKKQVIDFLQTYDPVTDQGMWSNTVRMSDGRFVSSGRLTPARLEDLVSGEVTKDGSWRMKLPIGKSNERSTYGFEQGLPMESFERVMALHDAGSYSKAENVDPTDAEADLHLYEGGARVGDATEAGKAGREIMESIGAKPMEKVYEGGKMKFKEAEPTEGERPVLFEEDTKPDLSDTNVYRGYLEFMNELEIYRDQQDSFWAKFGPKIFTEKQRAEGYGKRSMFWPAFVSRLQWGILNDSVARQRDRLKRLTPEMQMFYELYRQKNSKPTKPLKGLDEMATFDEKTRAFREAQRSFWQSSLVGGGDFQKIVKTVIENMPDVAEAFKDDSGKVAGAWIIGKDFKFANRARHTFKPRLENTGNPLEDVMATFYRHGKTLGFSDESAMRFAEVAGKFWSQSKAGLRFGSISDELGFAGLHFTQRTIPGGAVTVATADAMRRHAADAGVLSEHLPAAAATGLLKTLVHEITHSYADLPQNPSRMDIVRFQSAAMLNSIFTEMKPPAVKDLIHNILPEALLPPEITGKIQHPLPDFDAPDFNDEAISQIAEYVGLGIVTGKDAPQRTISTIKDVLEWLPSELLNYSRFVYRDVNNVAGAIVEMNKASDHNVELGKYWGSILDYTNRMLGMHDELAKAETQAKAMLSRAVAFGSFNADALPRMVLDVYDSDRNFLMKYDVQPAKFRDQLELPEIVEGVQNKGQGIRYAGEVKAGIRTGGFSKFFNQAFQLLDRYRKMGMFPDVVFDTARTLNDLEASFGRLAKKINLPFYKEDEAGMLVWDEKLPINLLMSGKHPQHKEGKQAMHDLFIWGQDEKVGITRRREDGTFEVNPQAEKQVQKALKGLQPDMQQAILDTFGRMYEGYQNAAREYVNATKEKLSHSIARAILAHDRSATYHVIDNVQFLVEAGFRLEKARLNVEELNSSLKRAVEKNGGQMTLNGQPIPEIAQIQQAILAAKQAQVEAIGPWQQGLASLSEKQAKLVESRLSGELGSARSIAQLDSLFAKRGDWYMTEQRPGRFMVTAKTPGDKPENYLAGFHHIREAEAHAKELLEQGYQAPTILDRNKDLDHVKYNVPDTVIQQFIETERVAFEKWMQSVEKTLDPETVKVLRDDHNAYVLGQASEQLMEAKSLAKWKIEREGKPGRETIDPMDAYHDYVKRMVGTISRNTLRHRIDLILADPRMKNQQDYANSVRLMKDSLLDPTSEDFPVFRTALVASYLGLPQLVSMPVEASQSVTTVIPELRREAPEKSYGQVLKYFGGSFKNLWKYSDGTDPKNKAILESAKRKLDADLAAGKVIGESLTKEESMVAYFRRAVNEEKFKYGVAQAEMHTKDQGWLQTVSSIEGTDLSSRTPGELAKDMVYNLARWAMYPYTQVSMMNNKVAFMSALDMYYDKGYRGQDLYDRTSLFVNRSTFGGGKPNELGVVNRVSNHETRSYVGMLFTLQKYAFGSVSQIKGLIDESVGRLDVSPQERKAAREAAAHALGVQMVFAGAMGVPGALIVSTMLEKMFGFDAKQKAREVWHEMFSRLTTNETLATMLTNVAQNGIGGQMLGVDLSSRFTINSYLGFDAFEGFNAANLGGPAAGIVERLYKAGQYAAKGDAVKATKSALPPAFSSWIDTTHQLGKYGQVGLRDEKGKLLAPMSTSEAIGYTLGARPYKYRLIRDQQAALIASNKAFGDVRTREIDDAAGALNDGDTSKTYDWVRQYLRNAPGADPRDAFRSVVDRALTQQNALDLMRQTVTGNEASARRIAESFGDNGVPRTSEVNLLMQRERLNARLGYAGAKPMDSKDVTRAAIIDALVNSRKTTRSEAVRMADLMGF